MFINPLKRAGRDEFGVSQPILSCPRAGFWGLEWQVTRQEHSSILSFLDGVLNAPAEPLDVEADAIIRAYFKRNPDIAYRLTRFAMGAAPAPAEPGHRRRLWLAPLFERRVKGALT